jgi:hypothetical protein
MHLMNSDHVRCSSVAACRKAAEVRKARKKRNLVAIEFGSFIFVKQCAPTVAACRKAAEMCKACKR